MLCYVILYYIIAFKLYFNKWDLAKIKEERKRGKGTRRHQWLMWTCLLLHLTYQVPKTWSMSTASYGKIVVRCMTTDHLSGSNLQHTCEKNPTRLGMPVAPTLGGWDNQAPGANWPTSLAKAVSFQLIERLCLNKVDSERREHTIVFWPGYDITQQFFFYY